MPVSAQPLPIASTRGISEQGCGCLLFLSLPVIWARMSFTMPGELSSVSDLTCRLLVFSIMKSHCPSQHPA